MRRRVGVYLTRQTPGGLELLVFDCPQGCGLEPPGGGIDGDETPAQAAVREVAEETGIAGVRVVRELGEHPGLTDAGGPQLTIWVHAELVGEAPQAWEHVVAGSGDDAGVVHRLSWVGLPLDVQIAAGHDALLQALLA